MAGFIARLLVVEEAIAYPLDPSIRRFHLGPASLLVLWIFRRSNLLNVRFGSKADMRCPLSAKSGHYQLYWITSSARATIAGGTVRPSALAVLRLIASSNFVGSSTGRSPGASPFRMRAT